MWLFSVGYFLVLFFFLLLLVRLVLEWIQVFAREWRPSGVVLLVAEAAYTVTDPPLKALRRILPPLRIGQMSLDLAFLALSLICWVLMSVFLSLGA